MVVSTGEASFGWLAAWANAHGMMSRARVVLKTTGSWMSVRGVATWLSARTRTVWGCGADNQKVTSPRAAAGGRSSTPISSRNLM